MPDCRSEDSAWRYFYQHDADHVLFVISRAAPNGRRMVEPLMVEMSGEILLYQAQNNPGFLP